MRCAPSAASRAASVPDVSSGWIGSCRTNAVGPESSPAVIWKIVTPVTSSPAMIARSIGAAPRQRGSTDGCTFSIVNRDSSGSLISWPNWQTAIMSGAASSMRASDASSLTVSAWCSSRPRSRAARATGGGDTLRPRPAGRSGGVTTSCGRCGDVASAPSTSTAKVEVPR